MDQAHQHGLHLMSDLTKALLDRLVVPIFLVMLVFLFGTFGFFFVGDGRWELFDCAYMTTITLTTVGYGEVLDNMGTSGRMFAMILMWSGMGVTLYSISTITAFVVEENLSRYLRERKMEKRIAALKNHYIVCGAGKTGINVCRELITSKRSCVMIELKPERIQWMRKHFQDMHFIQGDATEEEVLKKAGIEKAAGVLATLDEDSRNLLITVQTRFVNPDVKIVARCQENSLSDKFYRAGADYVVNPAFIGGMRMASEMVRPNVVSFLDRMLRGKDKSVRVEEVIVCDNSPWVGRTLRDVKVHEHTGLVPISVKHPEDDDFRYNPSPDEILTPGTIVIIVGNPQQVAKLKSYCSLAEDEGLKELKLDK